EAHDAGTDLSGGHDDHDDEHHAIPADFKPHESPWTMTVPLIVLAILSTVGGLVGIPYAVSSLFGAGDINAFERTLEPVIAKVGHGVEAPSHAPVQTLNSAPAETANAPAAETHGAAAEQ